MVRGGSSPLRRTGKAPQPRGFLVSGANIPAPPPSSSDNSATTIAQPEGARMAPKQRGSDGSIYSYKTKDGTRWRFMFRDSRGRQSTRRGFTSRREAQRERERLLGKVHRGEIRASREDLAGFWERYLHARRPYLENG